jgi:hypothetical protein
VQRLESWSAGPQARFADQRLIIAIPCDWLVGPPVTARGITGPCLI